MMQTLTFTDHLYLATDADGNIWAHKTRGDPILSKVYIWFVLDRDIKAG